MELEVGKWYYFNLMGHNFFLKVYDENEYEYKVEHFLSIRDGNPEYKREKSYVNKASKSLNSYIETNQKEIIEKIFT